MVSGEISQDNHPTKNKYFQDLSAKAKSVSTIVRAYKSAVTIESRIKNGDFAWRPRFYDHIIRSEPEWNRIANYILNNPLNWKEDKFYLKDNLRSR